MQKLLSVSALLAASTSLAVAGGIERSTQSTAILFEDGDYAEFSFSVVDPDVSGSLVAAPAVASGDVLPSFLNFGFGYKRELNDQWSVALIVDQPIGADVSYSTGAAPYPFAGSTASVNAVAVTGLVRYKTANNLSFFGGVRIQEAKGEASIPPFNGFTLGLDSEVDVGYVAGIAYEIPDIALRVALTYNSKITHNFTGVTETSGGNPIPGAPPIEVEVPQSVNLEFQSGIAKDTLLFGSVRWVDWTEFNVTPVGLGGAPLVSFADDRITYNLGIGRKFNDNWSGAITIGHESSTGSFQANLSPRDGFNSIGIAATYTSGPMKITGGIRYIDVGNATTTFQGNPLGSFSDNDAIAAGIRIGYSF